VNESSPILNISIFGVFVLVTLFVVIRASRNTKTAADYLAAGRAFTGPQNGIAIAGDYLSAASRCCWSPSCCATPASTRWATC
jgi:cation/acetate symporter